MSSNKPRTTLVKFIFMLCMAMLSLVLGYTNLVIGRVPEGMVGIAGAIIIANAAITMNLLTNGRKDGNTDIKLEQREKGD